MNKQLFSSTTVNKSLFCMRYKYVCTQQNVQSVRRRPLQSSITYCFNIALTIGTYVAFKLLVKYR